MEEDANASCHPTVPPDCREFNRGRALPCPGVPLDDRGFRYGMHFFETLPVVHGRPRMLQRHLDKLTDAAGQAGWRIPDLGPLANWLNAEPLPDGILRMYLTAGDGAPTDPVTTPRLFTTHHPGPTPAPPPRPLDVAVMDTEPLISYPPLSKSGNYWSRADARRRCNADESLVFTTDGLLVGASMANAFLKCGGEWLTPSAASGRRAGVVHDWTLERLNARPATLRRKDVEVCEAGFLTNSRIGLASMCQIGGRPLTVDPDIASLQDRFWRGLGDDAAESG